MLTAVTEPLRPTQGLAVMARVGFAERVPRRTGIEPERRRARSGVTRMGPALAGAAAARRARAGGALTGTGSGRSSLGTSEGARGGTALGGAAAGAVGAVVMVARA